MTCPICGRKFENCPGHEIEEFRTQRRNKILTEMSAKELDFDSLFKDKVERADDLLFAESHGLTDFWAE